MNKLLDLTENGIKELISTLEQGLKGVVKMTKDNVFNTIKGKGMVDMSLNPSQIKRLNQAHDANRGLKLTLTRAQSDRMKSGGFLGALAGMLPSLAGAASALGPVLAKGALVGIGAGGASLLMNKIFGKGMKTIQLGDGLYLRPYQSGSGMKSGNCKYCAVIGNAKGDRVKVTGGFLKNILGTLSGIMPF
jgi:hypothetical protein